MDIEPNTNDVAVPVSDIEEVGDIEYIEDIDMAVETAEESNGVIHDQSVQISPTVPANMGDERSSIIELGDYVVFETTAYGRIIGTVMYRSLERISIKPDGISHYLQHFMITQEDGEDIFDEKDGITDIYIIEKRKYKTFVEQQDFRVGQLVDTFDSDQQPYKLFKIIHVNQHADSITLEDPDDKEQPYEVLFKGIGIDSDEPISVIRVRPTELNERFVDDTEEEAVPPLEEEEEEELEIEDVGVVEMTLAKVYKEAAAFEQRIPDDLQKIDALNDFISGLDPAVQKDPRAIRSIRILVETLFNLKQETVQYNSDGSIDGIKTLSAKSIRELIDRVHIPLGRPVLSVNKKEYLGYSIDGELYEIPASAKGAHFLDFNDELARMKQPISKVVSAGVNGSIIREWKDQHDYLTIFLSPWKPNSMERLWNVKADSEFFRSSDTTQIVENDIVPLVTTGYPPMKAVKQDKQTMIVSIFNTVSFGLERGLSTTFRKGSDRSKQTLIKEEGASLSAYMLFPPHVANQMGSTRSRYLAHDTYRSKLLPLVSMRDQLKKFDGPMKKGTTNDVLILDIVGNTFGNISLTDYIDGMTIPALGLGDTFDTLAHYGIDQLEFQPDMVNVLLPKLEAYQSQLLSTLATLRNMISSQPKEEPEHRTMISNPPFLEIIRNEPMLLEYLNEFQRIQPNLAHSDIGQVSHLMKHASNYFQVAAGNDKLLKGKAFLQAGLTEYLNQLTIANQIRYNEQHSGSRPVKNTCPHVADLVSVRRISDDSERMFQFTKFFKRYQGVRSENWINCNSCKENLLCIHERLQIQAYLNPKEKQTIEKQMVLSFAGGQFQGKYICRNCGQAIRDLDFDNNLEFDDNGRPKSGTAVLVDYEAIMEEKIEELIRPPTEDVPQIQYTAEEMKLYHVIRELAERVGVELDATGFRHVIDDTMRYMNSVPRREEYGSKKKLSYEVFVIRYMVCACAAFTLIEIQSKIPSYLIRYTLMGCPNPGFDGIPLSTDNNMQGLEYMACAVSTITRKSPPWNQTGFQEYPDEKRMKGVLAYLMDILAHSQQNADIQSRLSLKRRYLLDVLGRSVEGEGAFAKESIMPSFLPEQLIITPEEAAKDVIKPEVAEMMGNQGKQALVKFWIRQSHAIARSTAKLVKSSSLSETTCCTSSLTTPGSYWKNDKNFPQMAGRSLTPNIQGSMLLTDFKPRDASMGVVEPDADLYHRLFLKCCFTGPRIGHSHEPGLTNRCTWCGLQFPSHPKVMDTDKEGKAALSEVDTSTNEFIGLLDSIHNVNKVKPLPKKEVTSLENLMKQLGEIEPAPIENWMSIIEQTTIQCKRLEPNAQRDEIAQAVGLLSESTRDAEALIFRGKTMTSYKAFLDEKITELPWADFFNVLQIYFVIPIQRFLTQFNTENFVVPKEMKKILSETHVDEDLQPLLDHEMDFLHKKESDMKNPRLEFARTKLTHYLNQLRVILPFKNIIRPIVVPGKERTLVYIQKAIFYGTLSTLLDSGDVPRTVKRTSAMQSASDPSAEFILRMFTDCVKKYSTESLSYDDKLIKEMIETRNEKERVHVVKEMDKLTDEERAIELKNKQLGIGKWSVGGTKVIFAYDKDYYDQERQKRQDAGITDFPGSESAMAFDEYGFREYGDNDYEREGGYDHNQHGDDDRE